MTRKLQFFGEQVTRISGPALNLRIQVENAIEERLKARSNSSHRLVSDNDLFIPFIDAFVYCTMATPLVSIVKEIGDSLSLKVSHFEQAHNTKVNKEHFYYALAAVAIQQNDEVNAMIYWEMANDEYTQTNGAPSIPNAVVSLFKDKFTQVYNPIVSAYQQNSFINKQRAKYPFILGFDALLGALPQIDQLHLISNAVRNRKTQAWLREHPNLTVVKMYCQELVNSLSIQAESFLKENAQVTETQFGKILHRNLPAINPAVHALLDDPTHGIFKRYRINDIPSFNAAYSAFMADIESTTSADDFKAKILHFANVLRNQVLHQFDDSIAYYQNKDEFEKVIGILFVAISVIVSL